MTAQKTSAQKTSTKKVSAKKTANTKSKAISSSSPGMSDAAVKAKTGRTWPAWVKVLKALRADKLDHRAIAKLVAQKFKLSNWWAQTVTVGFERLTGKRKVHETKKGFVANAGKVCAGSALGLYDAFAQKKNHKALYGKPVAFSTMKAAKALRFPWADGKSRVLIAFYRKAKAKTLVTAQHEKLKTAKDVAAMKALWRGIIARAEKLAR